MESHRSVEAKESPAGQEQPPVYSGKLQALEQRLQAISAPERIVMERELAVAHTWAKGEGIHQALACYLGEFAHIIHPELSSVHSPLATGGPQAALPGAVNYVRAIQEKIKRDGGSLRHPIIMVMNTKSVQPVSALDAGAVGGRHWVTSVVLPPYYVTPSGVSLYNAKTRIFFWTP